MPIKNYTTQVAEERTVGEIMSLLACKGARSIRIDYDERNRPSAIGFIISIKSDSAMEVPVPFRLPCNFDGVYRAIRETKRWKSDYDSKPGNREQSRRIAWRIVKDWVAAQMALIEAGCASLAQVFLPYAVVMDTPGGSVTMFDKFMAQVATQKALPEAPPEPGPEPETVNKLRRV